MSGTTTSSRKSRSRADTGAAREGRRRPAPVTVTNLLEGVADALYELAVRTGDVRKVRKVGPSIIELDIEDARALGLV